MNNKPVVHIVDDDDSIRDSLRMFFESFDIRARLYHSAQNFIDTYEHTGPCCVLVDLRMPHINGLQLLEILDQKNINVPIIMMTGYGEITTAVQAMKAGAVDFVEKPFNHENLLNIIYQSVDNHENNQHRIHDAEECLKRLATLTQREREVLNLITNGLINKLVAARLDISTRTVEAHRASIMEKLEAHSLSDLVKISVLAENQEKM